MIKGLDRNNWDIRERNRTIAISRGQNCVIETRVLLLHNRNTWGNQNRAIEYCETKIAQL